ncbi:hypothetical protein JKP88DRAFT_265606 [Tribonema minus]|uniref:Transcription initiation factor TFIID subunit 12 domain-containing protein n=1 Tax=Tribonema minus TaxID=303371 RepID=A0A836C7I5_9STRA|nr:hypothetical protein JKP88DRAFT_265606 [Tribonema minus]
MFGLTASGIRLVLLVPLLAASDNCNDLSQYTPNVAVRSVVADVGNLLAIELGPQIPIEGGCGVSVPIRVPDLVVSVDGSAPAPVQAVRSTTVDGEYGAGDSISIQVQFSNTVTVVQPKAGAQLPALELLTGCHSPECTVPEVQQFQCRASEGSFSVSFNGHTVTNLNADFKPETLRDALQMLPGINSVEVLYQAGQQTVCTETGNIVTVKFLDLDWPTLDRYYGDVPPLEFDYLNAPVDPQTLRTWGDGSRLCLGYRECGCMAEDKAGVNSTAGAYAAVGMDAVGDPLLSGVFLPHAATQVVKGFRQRNSFATYFNGSGTSMLDFRYEVAAGDMSSRLEYASTGALLPGDCNITGANLALPIPGAPASYYHGTGSSLGVNSRISINTLAPVVVMVTSPAENRSYGTGEVIAIQVVFDQPVVADLSRGSPTLLLETGVFDHVAVLVNVTGSTLTFKYTVALGDSNADLGYHSSTALSSNGALVYRKTAHPTTLVNLELPPPGAAGSLAASKDITVRPTTVNALDVNTDTVDGTYGAGQHIIINVMFGWWQDEEVPVRLLGGDGTGLGLMMRTGIAAVATVYAASYVSVGGVWRWQVVLEEGHHMNATHVGRTFTAEGVSLTLTSVVGNAVSFNNQWIGTPVDMGVPIIQLKSDGTQTANYVGGNGTTMLSFQYVVEELDSTLDLDYSSTASLVLPVNTTLHRVADEVAAAIDVVLPPPGQCVVYKGCSLAGQRAIVIDTTPPSVVSVSSLKAGQLYPYSVNDVIDITVHYNKEVVVAIPKAFAVAPRLHMSTGGYALYYKGNGTTALTFLYQVTTPDVSLALETYQHPLKSPMETWNAGVNGYIRRAATVPTTDADDSFPVAGTTGSLSSPAAAHVFIDTTAPHVTAVQFVSPVAGQYSIGQSIVLQVTFSAPVTVSGSPAIRLTSGGSATYTASPTTSQLTFQLVVGMASAAGELDIYYDSTWDPPLAAIRPNGGSISHAVTAAAAALTLPPGLTLSSYGIVINTTPPKIIAAACEHVSGRVGVGEIISLTVTFDQPVVVVGHPTLPLDVGDTTVAATYNGPIGGAGQLELEFSYAVTSATIPGQSTSDLDAADPAALVLSAGDTIYRSSTTPSLAAVLDLPPRGQPGSLGMNCAVWVDTTQAAVASVSTRMLAGTYGIAATLQTIEIAADPGSVASGQFALGYGELGPSHCISVTTLDATTLRDAIRAINTLMDVTVTSTVRVMENTKRYQVSFAAPTSGVFELWWDVSAACSPFLCNGVPCTNGGVIVNRNIPPPLQQGLVEVVVAMTEDVVVAGVPTLTLQLNTATALATWQPGSIQYVDVGVSAANPVTSGYFRVQYAGFETGCIDIRAADTDAGSESLRSRLLSVPAAALVGVVSVASAPVGNGVRFAITFASALAGKVTAGASVCPSSLPAGATVEVPNTNELYFVYQLSPGDKALAIVASQLTLPGGATIKRASSTPTQDAIITLPSSLEARTILDRAIDCSVAPQVTHIMCTAFGGKYGTGQRLYLAVTFNIPVVVSGNPVLHLNSGTALDPAKAEFYATDGANIVTFRYTVLQGQSTPILAPYSAVALSTQGGAITSAAGRQFVAADLTLPAGALLGADGTAIEIDTAAVLVPLSLIVDKAAGTYSTGEEVMLTTTFPWPVAVMGTPYIQLSTRGRANYTQGGHVQVIDIVAADDLEVFTAPVAVTAGSFRVAYDGHVSECVPFNDPSILQAALEALPALQTPTPVGHPYVDTVSVASYHGGSRFTITFAGGTGKFQRYASAVQIPWNWYEGCAAMFPMYAKPARADSSTAAFLYTVSSGEVANPLGLGAAAAIVPCCDTNSYVRRSQSKPTMDAFLSLVLPPPLVNVDTTAPAVVSVAEYDYGNGAYGYGDVVILQVTFDLPVVVDDASPPQLALVIGRVVAGMPSISTVVPATYAAASSLAVPSSLPPDDTSIFLMYTVAADDFSASLTYQDTASLSGTIWRASSHPITPADLTLPAPGTLTGITVNAASQPTVVYSVSAVPSSGSFNIGGTVNIVVRFTRPVKLSGSGSLMLDLDVGSSYLIYATASSADAFASTISLQYDVKPGHKSSDLDYRSTASLTTPTGTVVVDASGTAVDLTLPPPGSPQSLAGTSDIVVAGTSMIWSVDSLTPDGTYYTGESIFIRVRYSSPVVVVGVPLLMMKIGTDPNYHTRATYVSGSETSDLIFEYIVQPGENTIRLGYDGTNAIYYPTTVEAHAAIKTAEDLDTDADTSMPETWSLSQLNDEAYIQVDTGIPVVVDVSTDTPHGVYGVGEHIVLNVQFSKRVYVKRSISLPYMELPAGSIAPYVGGNNTYTMGFEYVVQPGDSVALFDYRDTRTWKRQNFSYALQKPPVAEIKAASARPTTDAELVLPCPGQHGSISNKTTITIDTTQPTVHRVTVTSPDGVYFTDDVIELLVEFTQPVVFTGTSVSPSLLLRSQTRAAVGGVRGERRASYVSGNGTAQLHLQYVVQRGDYTPLLDYQDTGSLSMYPSQIASLQYRDGRARRTATDPQQDASLVLPQPGAALTAAGPFSIVGSGDKVAIQTRNVTAISVSSPQPDGIYCAQSIILVDVTFTTPVRVTNVTSQGKSSCACSFLALLMLQLVARVVAAAYISGSGTDVLTYSYKVQATDHSPHLDVIAPTPTHSALQACFACIVEASTGEPVYLNSIPGPGVPGSLGASKDIIVDGDALLVTQVTSTTPDGTYGAGERIEVAVHLLQPMVVVPALTATLKLNVKDSAGHNVIVPQHSLSTDRMELLFVYTINDGDNQPASLVLDYADTASLGGQLRFNSTLNSTLPTATMSVTLPPPGSLESLSGSSSIIIDTTPPFVVSVTSPMPDGMYTLGAVIDIVVTFSAPVTFPVAADASASQLMMDVSGAAGVAAVYRAGSGSYSLFFRYTVLAGHGTSDLDVVNTAALHAAGLMRSSSAPQTPAVVLLPLKGAAGSLGANSDIVINTLAVQALSAGTLHADGTYGVGEMIWVHVAFSGPVTVLASEAAPYLLLNSAAAAKAVYASGSGTNTLRFVYTVSEGDSSLQLDYLSSYALHSGAALYQMAAPSSVPLIVYLPPPGSHGSLSDTSAIVIDTSQPTVERVTSTIPNGIYGAGEHIPILTTFSAPVRLGAGNVKLFVSVGEANGPAPCTYSSGSGTDTLTWMYVVREGDSSTDLATDSAAGPPFSNGSILRSSTHSSQEALLSVPTEGLPASLSGSKDIRIDTRQPHVWGVATRRGVSLAAGQIADLHVLFDTPVVVNGTPRVAVGMDDGTIRYALYNPNFTTLLGPGETSDHNTTAVPFTFVVKPEDKALRLHHYAPASLELNGGTIKRQGASPVTDALVVLPSPTQALAEGGSGILNAVYGVEVTLHGLYHSSVLDLEAVLRHGDDAATLINGTSRYLEMGIPPMRELLPGDGSVEVPGALEQPLLSHGASGRNYPFAGTCGPNLAMKSGANALQSSTQYAAAASKAIDGNRDGVFSSGAIILTQEEESPWWQVQLEAPSTVGHIRIFGSTPELGQAELQAIYIESSQALYGSFYLTVHDRWKGSATTLSINIEAPCTTAEETASTLGKSVASRLRSAAATLGAGITVSVESCAPAATAAAQRAFIVSLQSDFGDILPMTVNAAGVAFMTQATVTTLREGTAPGTVYHDGAVRHVDPSHMPLWVMLFASAADVSVDMTLEEARAAAVWVRYLEDNGHGREANVALPEGVVGEVVRLQLGGIGQLALAEVEIYEQAFPSLLQYGGSTPVPEKYAWEPFMAVDSPSVVFDGAPPDGTWMLEVVDKKAATLDRGVTRHQHKFNNGDGGFAGWSLTLVDYFGNSRSFANDAYITIETLPTYGTLYTSSDAAPGSDLRPAGGFEPLVGICRGSGDAADASKPVSSTVDGKKSPAAAPVNVKVRQCRLHETGQRQPLCACTAPADAQSMLECFQVSARACQSCSSPLATFSPASYRDFNAECLLELAKVTAYMRQQGYCADTYELPLCRGEAADKLVGASIGLEPAIASVHFVSHCCCSHTRSTHRTAPPTSQTGVQELMLEVADEFATRVVDGAAQLAKHRGAGVLDATDIQLFLRKAYGMHWLGIGALPQMASRALPARVRPKHTATTAHVLGKAARSEAAAAGAAAAGEPRPAKAKRKANGAPGEKLTKKPRSDTKKGMKAMGGGGGS